MESTVAVKSESGAGVAPPDEVDVAAAAAATTASSSVRVRIMYQFALSVTPHSCEGSVSLDWHRIDSLTPRQDS